MLYITCRDMSEAQMISKCLIEERLVACVNIIDNMVSMYIWKGEVVDDQEVIIIAKTQLSNFANIESRVLELHSYEVPCIVALPFIQGHVPYIQWIAESTVQ